MLWEETNSREKPGLLIPETLRAKHTLPTKKWSSAPSQIIWISKYRTNEIVRLTWRSRLPSSQKCGAAWAWVAISSLLLLQVRTVQLTLNLKPYMCWQILAGQCNSHQPVVDFVKVHPLFLTACQTAHNKGYPWTIEIFTTCAMSAGHKQPGHSHRKMATCRGG